MENGHVSQTYLTHYERTNITVKLVPGEIRDCIPHTEREIARYKTGGRPTGGTTITIISPTRQGSFLFPPHK